MSEKVGASRRELIIVGGIVLAFVIICAFSLTDLSLFSRDSGRNLIWAGSISSFRGYIDATLPEPQRFVTGAPLYPIILAPVALLFPHGVVAAKIVSMLFGAALLLLFRYWMRNGRRPAGGTASLLALALFSLNPLTIVLSTEVLAEIPFALALVACFMLYENVDRDSETPVLYLALFAGCVAVAVLLREAGMALLAAAVVALLIDRKRRAAIAVAASSLASYCVWFVRNEVIVAAREPSALTGAKFFFGRFYTSPQTGLLGELTERVMLNGTLYGAWIARLLFSPLYPGDEYKLVSMRTGLAAMVSPALPLVMIVLGLIAAALVVRGVLADSKAGGSLFVYCFAGLYFLLLLVYPVNDIRLLFPLLVVAARFAALGIDDIRSGGFGSLLAGRVPAIVVPVVALALMPNLLWDIQYAVNCSGYRANPVAYAESVQKVSGYPWHLSLPFSAAAKRLEEIAPSQAIVVSAGNDLALNVAGRPTGILDPGMQLTQFDAYLRDYRVPFIVNTIQPNGMRDFEFLMTQSRLFRFTAAGRIGNIELTAVEPVAKSGRGYDSPSAFGLGVEMLDSVRYADAEALFTQEYERAGDNTAALFFRGLARELGGNLEAAADDFVKIRTVPRAGALLPLARKHQSVVATLKTLQGPFSAAAKAEAAANVASEYWAEGLRVQARAMSDQSMRLDSAYLPSALYGMYYALQEEDTMSARSLYSRAVALDTARRYTAGWKFYFESLDSMLSAENDSARSAMLIPVARAMRAMGMAEGSLQVLLKRLHEVPSDVETMSLLAKIYEERGQYLPAARMLSMIVAADPTYPAAKQKLQELSARFH